MAVSGHGPYESMPGIYNARGPADQQHGVTVGTYPFGGYAKMPIYNQAFTTPLEFATAVIASFFSQHEVISLLFPQIPTDHVQIRWEEFISLLSPFGPIAPQAPAPETYMSRRAVEGGMQSFAQQFTLDNSIRGTYLQDLYSGEHARNIVANMHLTVYAYVMQRMNDVAPVYALLWEMMARRSGVASSHISRTENQLSTYANMTGCINKQSAKVQALPYISALAKRIIGILSPHGNIHPDFILLPECLKEYLALETKEFTQPVTKPIMKSIIEYVDSMVPGARNLDFSRILAPEDLQHFEHMMVRFLGPVRTEDNPSYDVLEQTVTFGQFFIVDEFADKVEIIDHISQTWKTVFTRKTKHRSIRMLSAGIHDGTDAVHYPNDAPSYGGRRMADTTILRWADRDNMRSNVANIGDIWFALPNLLGPATPATVAATAFRDMLTANEVADASRAVGSAVPIAGMGGGPAVSEADRQDAMYCLRRGSLARGVAVRAPEGGQQLAGAWYIGFRPYIQLRGHGMYIGVRGERTGVVFIGQINGPTKYELPDVRRNTTFMQMRVGFILLHPEHIVRIPCVYFSDHNAGGGTRCANTVAAEAYRVNPISADVFLYEIPRFQDLERDMAHLETVMSARYLNSSGRWRPSALAHLNKDPRFNWVPIEMLDATTAPLTHLQIDAPEDIKHITDYGMNGQPTELMARGKWRSTYSTVVEGRTVTTVVDSPTEQGPLAPTTVESIESWRGMFPRYSPVETGPKRLVGPIRRDDAAFGIAIPGG